MQEIMKSQMGPNEEKSSVVKLDHFFDMANEGGQIVEVFATFSECGVKLARMSTISGNHSFGFSDDIMDNLADAWECFKAQCQAVDLKEKFRVQSVQKEIDDIVRSYPEINIQESKWRSDLPYWMVSSEEPQYYTEELSTIDALLEEVKGAKECIDTYKATMKTIRAVLVANPEMYLEAREEGGVTQKEQYVQAKFNDWTMHCKYARDHTELLEQVQAAETELKAVKESYRIASKYGLLITKMGSGWNVRDLASKQEKNLHSHTSEDLLAYVIAVTGQAPEPAQTDTTQDFDRAHDIEKIFAANAE